LLAGEDVRPLTLVVPDGNWSQARRIALRVQGLEGLPRAYLSAVGESGAALPDAAPPELSTGEAIARALGMIESAAVEHALRAWRLSLVPSEVQAGAAHQADGGERAPSASFAADPLEVLYEDEDFVAVHKPAGMLVHRGWGNDGVPALQVLRDQLGKRVFPVHRLDRATSGVLLFAFSPELARDTQLLFQAGKVRKVYLALTRGNQIVEGSIEHPLALRAGSSPKPACTHLRRLGVFERYGLYEAEPLTGRTHQIRKHLKHVSHPLIGDVRYGKGEHNRVFRERFGFHRLALHCRELSFPHPRRAEQVQLLAQPRGDFARLLAQLGLDGRLSLRAEPESS
jgi:tRNA pseudouridine65 synthase